MFTFALIGIASAVCGLTFLAIIVFSTPRKDLPDNHPEVQNDFDASLARRRHIHERMSE
ncbi:MAG: hypothetical protein AAF408_00790 [Pseudomonadota bacterium]